MDDQRQQQCHPHDGLAVAEGVAVLMATCSAKMLRSAWDSTNSKPHSTNMRMRCTQIPHAAMQVAVGGGEGMGGGLASLWSLRPDTAGAPAQAGAAAGRAIRKRSVLDAAVALSDDLLEGGATGDHRQHVLYVGHHDLRGSGQAGA